MTAPVVVYGASGYTGKLICWHLAEAKIPFIAAGRSKARLEEQMALVPELVGADYAIAEVAHDKDALAAESCRRILDGRLLATGFQSPAKAFGARAILTAWADLGYHTWEASAT